jgi:hypothetical protein
MTVAENDQLARQRVVNLNNTLHYPVRAVVATLQRSPEMGHAGAITTSRNLVLIRIMQLDVNYCGCHTFVL